MSTPYVVIGLGKTGLACAAFLARKGIDFTLMDTRDVPPTLDEARSAFPKAPMILGRLDQAILSAAKTVIVSPGVSVHTTEIANAKAQGVEICGDIEIFVRFAEAPIAAITDTNGKSTLVTLLGEMAKAANVPAIVAGNIGTCVLDVLELPTPSWYILELSSFQLETTESLKADVACILNLSDDHMDRYHSLAEYGAAKKRIYHNAKHCVYNAEDDWTTPDSLANAKSFTSLAPKENQYGLVREGNDIYLQYGTARILSTKEIRIKGLPNYCNALAAIAIADFMGLPRAAQCQALREFPGLTHRLQWIRQVNGVDWYNDSKGTNVGACVQAVAGIGSNRNGKLILIAGGQGKGADFSPLAKPVADHCRAVVLIGEDAPIIASALNQTAPLHRATSLTEAVRLAYQLAEPEDAVVLSPACASFDMFNNFEHRGFCFVELVEELG